MVFKVVAFVFPLALDTLALSIALGLRGLRPWRPALLFAFFEGAMPLFGIALARVVSRRFETTALVTGGLVLLGLGFLTIREALQSGREKVAVLSFGSWRSCLAAGLAISTDELAVGFPMGALPLPLGMVLLTIVVQTLFVTVLGVTLGNRVRSTWARGASRYAGLAAGVVFALLGAWLIAERVLPIPSL